MTAALASDALPGVSAELRVPVIRGLRWTFWLAAAALPFSYATRVLLARAGRQPLAAYGLLLVFMNFVTAFLFLGGNAVAIRFLPQVPPERRRDFLRSYFAVVLLAWLPWLLVGWRFPAAWGWLFGGLGGAAFQRLMLILSPLPILSALLLAALKGALELAWAQWLYRAMTGATFLGCLAMFVLWRPQLQAHPAWLLWGWYLALTAACAVCAASRLVRVLPRSARARWFLPAGFWSFTLGLQASSALGFLAAQLDMECVLHAGSLRLLGSYTAIMALILILIAAVKLQLDNLMSALAHALARGDHRLAAAVWYGHVRLLLPWILLGGMLLACEARPLLAMYGPGYVGLATALRWLAPLGAVYGVNCLFGSTLSALGQPHAESKAKLIRIVTYLLLFLLLWHSFGLLGAVWAWGGAELAYQAANLRFLRRSAPFALRLRRLFPACLGAVAASAIAANLVRPPTAAAGLLLWVALAFAFLLAAGYSMQELRAQLRLLVPIPNKEVKA
jgi:O-antigen/teichoic acid export membrane protein